jgi:hypothetical protein
MEGSICLIRLFNPSALRGASFLPGAIEVVIGHDGLADEVRHFCFFRVSTAFNKKPDYH